MLACVSFCRAMSLPTPRRDPGRAESSICRTVCAAGLS